MNAYALITTLLNLAAGAIRVAEELKFTAAQNKELTPDEEADLDAKILAAKEGRPDHWKTEPDPALEPPKMAPYEPAPTEPHPPPITEVPPS